MGWRQAARRTPQGADQGPSDLAHRHRGTALILYLDTSAFLKLYVEEDGSAVVQAAVDAATLAATSALAYVEARAALARRRQAGDLTAAEHRRLVRGFEEDWDRYVQVDVTTLVLRDAAALAESSGLRAYDAVHLASARTMRARAGDVTFACWDRTLERVAVVHGFRPLAG